MTTVHLEGQPGHQSAAHSQEPVSGISSGTGSSRGHGQHLWTQGMALQRKRRCKRAHINTSPTITTRPQCPTQHTRHEVGRENQPQLSRGQSNWNPPFPEQLERFFCYFYWFRHTPGRTWTVPRGTGRSGRVKMRDADGEEGEALSKIGLHITKPKHQPRGKNSRFPSVLKGCSCYLSNPSPHKA